MISVHFCENNVMCCCYRRLKTGNGNPSPSDFQSVVYMEHFLLEAKKKKKAMTMCRQQNAAFCKSWKAKTTIVLVGLTSGEKFVQLNFP